MSSHCIHRLLCWAFVEREYFCQQNTAPLQVLSHPEGRWHVAISSAEKGKACLAIQVSLLERAQHLVFQPWTLPEHPCQHLGQGWRSFFSSLRSVIKWFLDALFLGGIINLFWEPRGNCSYLSEPQVISKQGWEYKELRGLNSLKTWWEGSFSAFFSCSKEWNCSGNSFEEQKCVLLNQISLDLSHLL